MCPVPHSHCAGGAVRALQVMTEIQHMPEDNIHDGPEKVVLMQCGTRDRAKQVRPPEPHARAVPPTPSSCEPSVLGATHGPHGGTACARARRVMTARRSTPSTTATCTTSSRRRAPSSRSPRTRRRCTSPSSRPSRTRTARRRRRRWPTCPYARAETSRARARSVGRPRCVCARSAPTSVHRPPLTAPRPVVCCAGRQARRALPRRAPPRADHQGALAPQRAPARAADGVAMVRSHALPLRLGAALLWLSRAPPSAPLPERRAARPLARSRLQLGTAAPGEACLFFDDGACGSEWRRALLCVRNGRSGSGRGRHRDAVVLVDRMRHESWRPVWRVSCERAVRV